MEILLTGMKISHINTRKQAGLAAGMKVQRCHRKLLEHPGKQNEISSYKHKTNSSCLPGCLAKQASQPARLPYKQPLNHNSIIPALKSINLK